MNRLAIAALSLAVLANALVFAGIALNRATVEATLTLTERELRLDEGSDENIGMSLDLSWNRALRPMSTDAMAKLGFDCSVPPDADGAWEHYGRQPSRVAFVVLEIDGPAWQREMAAVEAAHPLDEAVLVGEYADLNPDEAAARAKRAAEFNARVVAQQRYAASRLFAIDVGADANELRVRYPGTTRYAVVPGRIGIALDRDDRASAPARLEIDVYDLLVDRLHIAYEQRPFFQSLDREAPPVRRLRQGDWSDPAQLEPRYAVTVAFGARYEPWITHLSALP